MGTYETWTVRIGSIAAICYAKSTATGTYTFVYLGEAGIEVTAADITRVSYTLAQANFIPQEVKAFVEAHFELVFALPLDGTANSVRHQYMENLAGTAHDVKCVSQPPD